MPNIDPKVWGPCGWDFLFYIAFSYPEHPNQQEKQNIQQFFLSVGKVLPCETCRQNYHKHMQKHPINHIVLSNRYNLVIWLIKIKNEVNASLQKPLLSYKEVYERYILQKKRKTNTMLTEKHKKLLCMTLILVCIFVYFKNLSDN